MGTPGGQVKSWGLPPKMRAFNFWKLQGFIGILSRFPFDHSSHSAAPFGTNKISPQSFRADLEGNTPVRWQSSDGERGKQKQIKNRQQLTTIFWIHMKPKYSNYLASDSPNIQ